MPNAAAEVLLNTCQSPTRFVNITPNSSKLSPTSSIEERKFLHLNKDHDWRHLAPRWKREAV